MSSKAMSLKGRINHYARKNGIAAQVVLQNYMFERFLERLSKSSYQSKFVIKGGMLVAALVGMDTRATMDLDTTLRNLPLTEDQIRNAIEEICFVPLPDEVSFTMVSIDPIRKDDIYGGYRVRIDAAYDTVITPLSIDISTGDVITPHAVAYDFTGLFDTELRIPLWGYNIETILAEKVETILRRGTLSTRPRDLYDVFILTSKKEVKKDIFREALKATADHRGSSADISDHTKILERLESSPELRSQWQRYQRQFPYAKAIEYKDLISALRHLLTQEWPLHCQASAIR